MIYAGSNKFYAVQVDGEIVEIDMSMPTTGSTILKLNESIRMVGNGPAAALLGTDSMGTLIVGSDSLWLCTGVPLSCGKQATGFSMDHIERVEFLQNGIVYLKNGTTYVVPGSLSNYESHCGYPDKVTGGLVRLVPLNIDRYSPTGPGGVGYFLKDGRVYSCASTPGGSASADYAKTYEDFVGLADGVLSATLEEVKLTKPDADASVTAGYRFKYAGGAAVGVRKDYIPLFREWADESAEIVYNNSALCLRASGRYS